MRHRYACPTRWADLDLLGHVNNVVYVDYLQEARVDLFRTMLPHRRGDLTEGVVVVRHEVTYVASLTWDQRPVQIECWVTGIRAASFTLSYEVFHDDETAPGGRRVYLRATTVLTPFVFAEERPRRLTPEEKEALGRYLEDAAGEPAAPIAPFEPGAERRAHHYPLHVRFSDVDVYQHVNNVTYFEYLQEARIRLVTDVAGAADADRGHVVVVQTDVDYFRPILLRAEPYDCWTRVGRIGRTSMTFESEIRSEETVLARARCVVVFMDAASGRPAEPPAEIRERLADFSAAS